MNEGITPPSPIRVGRDSSKYYQELGRQIIQSKSQCISPIHVQSNTLIDYPLHSKDENSTSDYPFTSPSGTSFQQTMAQVQVEPEDQSAFLTDTLEEMNEALRNLQEWRQKQELSLKQYENELSESFDETGKADKTIVEVYDDDDDDDLNDIEILAKKAELRRHRLEDIRQTMDSISNDETSRLLHLHPQEHDMINEMLKSSDEENSEKLMKLYSGIQGLKVKEMEIDVQNEVFENEKVNESNQLIEETEQFLEMDTQLQAYTQELDHLLNRLNNTTNQ